MKNKSIIIFLLFTIFAIIFALIFSWLNNSKVTINNLLNELISEGYKDAYIKENCIYLTNDKSTEYIVILNTENIKTLELRNYVTTTDFVKIFNSIFTSFNSTHSGFEVYSDLKDEISNYRAGLTIYNDITFQTVLDNKDNTYLILIVKN